jgi:hypothetical protein
MPDPQQEDWPNRATAILGSTVPICVISVVVLVWRIVFGIRAKRKLFLADYLLIVATVSSAASPCGRLTDMTRS